MSKNKVTFCVMILLAAMVAGCAKSSSNPYDGSIKDKTWWGKIAYTGKIAENYSVHFNADNSLLWTQLSNNYEGHWTLDGKHLTISFTINTAKIEADITSDDKLENITDNTSFYNINSGQLIQNPKLSLENTVWKGSWVSSPYQINFLDGSKIKMIIGTTEYPVTYTRSASGAVIWFKALTYDAMGIFISDHVLEIYDDAENNLELTRK